MPDKKCSERSNDILITELQRMTKEAKAYLSKKKEEFLELKKQKLSLSVDPKEN